MSKKTKKPRTASLDRARTRTLPSIDDDALRQVSGGGGGGKPLDPGKPSAEPPAPSAC
jgi:hypothetical protein